MVPLFLCLLRILERFLQPASNTQHPTLSIQYSARIHNHPTHLLRSFFLHQLLLEVVSVIPQRQLCDLLRRELNFELHHLAAQLLRFGLLPLKLLLQTFVLGSLLL